MEGFIQLGEKVTGGVWMNQQPVAFASCAATRSDMPSASQHASFGSLVLNKRTSAASILFYFRPFRKVSKSLSV